ncbi:MAG TPA: CHAT domain-containing protein [Polyangiaceae bacterium]|nr:CHAT domain-containing protein [Polyangiaceae bacterium]
MADSRQLKSLPPGIAEEIQLRSEQLENVAVVRASGVENSDAKVREQTEAIASDIQMVLDDEVPLATIQDAVLKVVDETAARADIRQRGAQAAQTHRTVQASTALLQPVYEAPPALKVELERERPELERIGALRFSERSDEGEVAARELARRINARLEKPLDETFVTHHVLQEAQKSAAKVMVARDGSMMDNLRAQSSGKMKEVLARTGKISSEALTQATKDAFEGRLDDSLPILRAEFERTEAIYRLNPWQRVDESRDGRRYYFGVEAMKNMYLALVGKYPDNPELVSLAYEALLSHRVRNPEVERRTSAAMAVHPEGAELRRRWFEVREQIASLELQRSAGHALTSKDEKDLVLLGKQQAGMLEDLDRAAAPERIKDNPFRPAEAATALRSQLTPDAALVSFALYREVDAVNRDMVTWPYRYGAFVLTNEQLAWVSLGLATDIDAVASDFISALSAPGLALDAKKAAAAAFHRRVWQPLVGALGQRRNVEIIPDGTLQLVPFEAAYDGSEWLADTLRIRYELTERQVLGEYRPKVTAGPPLIVSGGPYAASPRPWRSGERLTRDLFEELPGLTDETREIQSLFPNAEVVSGERATDALFVARRAPRILHIAAHGIYLPRGLRPDGRERGLSVKNEPSTAPASKPEPRRLNDATAMSRSALVLSPSREPATDGFLTAYELATGSLWGTELVVLSACETGQGKPDAVRGVQGLRRAFFSIGAASLVTSLWSVDDQTTSNLMAEFYRGLASGADRVDALRDASRHARELDPDPRSWAPFVLFGRGGAIDQAPAADPRESDDARLRRALAQRRMQHSITEMGTASWSIGRERAEALDAFIVRDATSGERMVLTLLGASSSISLTVDAFDGAGHYSDLSVGVSRIEDPLAVEIQTLHRRSDEIELRSGTLDVAVDSVKEGFKGRFTLTFEDGRSAVGQFELASGLPPVPAWMQHAMDVQSGKMPKRPAPSP